MHRIARRLVAVLATVLIVTIALGACDPPPQPEPPGDPNAACTPGWQHIDMQSWWQKSASTGLTLVPQQLPASGVGGHTHVAGCLPVNQRVNGSSVTLNIVIKSHQRFTGTGDELDAGWAPGGSSVATSPAPDMRIGGSYCGGSATDPHKMCTANVTITVPFPKDSNGVQLTGKQILRLRYLGADHPNGERQFMSNEIPMWLNTNPGVCGETEAKGWFSEVEYARAGTKSCLPGTVTAVSGTYTFQQTARSTGGDHEPIVGMATFVDARFGHDEFNNMGNVFVPPADESSVTRTASIDTTKFTNGFHCIAVVTQTQEPGTDETNTGVLEFPIKIQNANPGTFVGRGSCIP